MDALILQKNPRELDSFRIALERAGFRVTSIPGADEALEACRGRAFDVVVLPWTKTAGTRRLIEGLRERGEPRPLVVAAVPKTADEPRALDAGADVCIPSSAGAPLFAARLRAALRRTGPAAPGEAQFRALFESSRDAIMLLDANGFFDCNRATLEMFGLPSKEEFTRCHPANLSPSTQPGGEDSRGAADRRIAEAFRQGHQRFEWIHRRRNGEDFPAEVWLTSFPMAGRTVLQATVRDLTERKKAEEALQKSEDQYTSLVNNVNIGVYRNTAGPQGRFLRANPAIVQMFGYGSEEEFLRIKVSELYEDPEDRQRFVQEILAHGEVRNRDLRLRRKDGTPFWGAVTARVARDERGDILWLDGVIEDVTERKRTEEALSESQRKFRAIIDQTYQFIGMTTTDGTLVEVNETALAFSGVRREDVLNKPFWEGPWWTHSPELQAKLRDAIRQAAAGRFMRFEVTHPAADGSLHTVDFSLKPIRDASGRVTMLVPEGRDITDSKRAEEELRKSEQRMRLHVQHTPLAVIEWDSAFRVLRWNPGAEKIFGYPAAEALGQHASFILPEKVRPFVDAVWADLMANKGGERATNENVTRDGRTILCEWYNTPLVDAEGKVVGVASLAQDITERQRAEEALRESERRLTDILQFFPDPTLVIDRGGRVTAWNRAMENLSGVKAKDMLGKGNYEHALPFYGERRPVLIDLALRDDPEMWKKYVSVDRREDILTGETWVPSLPQGKTYLYAAASVLRDSAGRAVGAIESIRDITDRKRVEEALRESEEKYRTLFDSAGDAIFIHDLKGKILAANRGACEYYGYTHEEMLSLSPAAVDTPEQAAHIAERIAALQEKGQIVFETVHRRKDGSRLPTEVNAQLVTFNGAPAVLAICRDITERKRAEEALQHAKTLAEDSARAKSEFLANMSHEIRTPLNGVLGMVGLALDGPLSDEQREYLELARSSADSLLGIINDILDFSKIEAKKLELEQVEFSLHDLCSETLPLAGFEAHRKGLELVCEIDPAIPAAVVGDPLRLKQTILNLLKNAVKFTPKGHVLIRVKKEGEPGPGFSTLHFSVSDTGIGIAQDQREKIFDSFTQADSGMTRKYGGTGLGLTISKNLVEMMGGTIRVESELGKGSTFHVSIPFLHAAAVPSAPPPPALKESRVLVVDDHALNRTILRKYLESWKMTVSEAEDGTRCLEEIRRARQAGAPYDLLLLDCMMPGMSGLEVVEQLKGEGEGGGFIIIMLTSLDEKGARERCRRLGIGQYLVKPVSPSTLFNAIIEILNQPEGAEAARAAARPGAAEGRPRAALFPAGLKILVAEDNAVNARLVLRLLEKVGLKADIAENGTKAVEAAKARDYDLILMDVQMPEMDGLQATQAIRERERGTGRHVPIVALTAHAIKGDRERFLAAGMDDYLSKPLHADQMYQMIGKYAPAGGAAPPPVPPPPPPEPSAAPLLDAAGLVARLGGDEALAREVLEIFLAEAGKALEKILARRKEGNAGELRSAAHFFKGMAANVSAVALQETCREIEHKAAAGDLPGAGPAVERLEGLLGRTAEAVRKHLGE